VYLKTHNDTFSLNFTVDVRWFSYPNISGAHHRRLLLLAWNSGVADPHPNIFGGSESAKKSILKWCLKKIVFKKFCFILSPERTKMVDPD
jgi:hypothetical protein